MTVVHSSRQENWQEAVKVEIRQIHKNKKEYLPLLLLADEEESWRTKRRA